MSIPAAVDVLADLRTRGFHLRRDGDRLLVNPGDRLAEADCVAIKAHKAELLAMLAAPTASPVPRSVPRAAIGPSVATDGEPEPFLHIWPDGRRTWILRRDLLLERYLGLVLAPKRQAA
jgi:hypothetical protein